MSDLDLDACATDRSLFVDASLTVPRIYGCYFFGALGAGAATVMLLVTFLAPQP